MSSTISTLTQQLFTQPSKAGSLSLSNSKTPTATDTVSEFLAYQKLSPQEKIVDSILKKYGLTKEDLANLSPDDLKKVQEEIKQQILSQTKQQMAEKGILVDLSA